MTVTAVRLIDTIGQDLGRLAGFKYWQDRVVLSYTTRSFAATAAQRAMFRHFVGIDQAPTNALFGGAKIKDVESGGGLNSNVAALAAAGAKFVAYTFMSNYPDMRHAVERTGKGGNVRYYIADWTASESRALSLLASDPAIVAVQWASPSFGGGIIVPGTNETVRQLNVDLNVGRLDFWLPSAPVPPKPQVARGLWGGQWALAVDTGKWGTTPRPGVGVVRSTSEVTDYAVLGVDLHTGQQRIKGIDRATGKRLLGS